MMSAYPEGTSLSGKIGSPLLIWGLFLSTCGPLDMRGHKGQPDSG